MCGFFGKYSAHQEADAAALQPCLLAAQRALHHRGPDDRGLETFSVPRGEDTHPGSLSLGHTRLSIIDLSPSGHQPMHFDGGRYTVVFNGEIYNYRELRDELKSAGYAFRTDSDTEVLLAAWAHWGLSGLRRLVGMFAFAVYDRQDESLTLVRDAFGIKPVFYSLDEASLSFASEVPALLELLSSDPEVDFQQAYDYLVHGRYDDRARTFYTGIVHLLPGHWLRVDLKTMHASAPRRWWWPSIKERTDLNFEDASAQLREIFLNSVRLHLRSDVPLGAALSGGVDSSAVVCAMRYLEPSMPIHTFSYIAKGSQFDEEKWIDIVNEHVGAIPHKITVTAEELSDDLSDLVSAQGEPFGTTSIYAQYRVFERAREDGVIVVLDGQGADECLAGYDGYPVAYCRDKLYRRDWRSTLEYSKHWTVRFGRGRTHLLKGVLASYLPPLIAKSLRRIRDAVKINRWTKPMALRRVEVAPDLETARLEAIKGRFLMSELRRDLTETRIRRLLRYEDRNSMSHSIESRVPFLTIEIVEFLLSLPADFLVSQKAETKRLFRHAMRGIVPDAILDRTDKIGFDTPQDQWMKKNWTAMRKIVLANEEDVIVNSRIATKFFDRSLERGENSADIWRIINYLEWKDKVVLGKSGRLK